MKKTSVKCYKVYISLIFLFGLYHNLLIAQDVYLHNASLQFLFEDSLYTTKNYHSVFKPMALSENAWLSKFPNSNDQRISLFSNGNENNYRMVISPCINAGVNFDNADQRLLYQFGEGAILDAKFGSSIGLEISGDLFEQSFSTANRYAIDTFRLVPGFNRVLSGNYQNTVFGTLNGFLYWKPMSLLTLRIGKDKEFWGDGYRSLYLSENAASFPFAQLSLKAWHIQYTYQFMLLQDVIPGFGSQRFDKYIVMHMLSYNLIPSLNVYAFEAVVWRSQDSTEYRGIEVNYLNPFLFIRPVEFSMGSPDNMVLGFGGRWEVVKHVQTYGQVIIDDFSTDVIEKTGWGSYVNKTGLQLGFKLFGGNSNRFHVFQMECNMVRPYVYSHDYSLENYGYLDRPIAHPSGANFKEIIAIYRQKFDNNWLLNIKLIGIQQGLDMDGKDDGSNIYISDDLHSANSGNYIGQGLLTDKFTGQINLSRFIVPSWRLSAGITVSDQLLKSNGKYTNTPMIGIGLKTLLYD